MFSLIILLLLDVRSFRSKLFGAWEISEVDCPWSKEKKATGKFIIIFKIIQ